MHSRSSPRAALRGFFVGCAADEFTAPAGLVRAGEKDAADFYTHSMGLGPGAEGMLGFAQAAIKQVQGGKGQGGGSRTFRAGWRGIGAGG